MMLEKEFEFVQEVTDMATDTRVKPRVELEMFSLEADDKVLQGLAPKAGH